MLSTATAAWIPSFPLSERRLQLVENGLFCNLPTMFYLSLGSPFQGAAPVPNQSQSHPVPLEMPPCKG